MSRITTYISDTLAIERGGLSDEALRLDQLLHTGQEDIGFYLNANKQLVLTIEKVFPAPVEGDWVPTLRGSSHTGTWTDDESSGGYMKAGKCVHCWCRIKGSLSGTDSDEPIFLAGLPFDVRYQPLGYTGSDKDGGISMGSYAYNGAMGSVLQLIPVSFSPTNQVRLMGITTARLPSPIDIFAQFWYFTP